MCCLHFINIFVCFLQLSTSNLRDEYKQHQGLLKDTVVWNIEQGLNLTSRDIAEAEARRTELYRHVASFLEKYDFLVLPVSQVAPFSVEIDWIREINGIPMAVSYTHLRAHETLRYLV